MMEWTENPWLSNLRRFRRSRKNIAMWLASVGGLIMVGWVLASQLTHLDEAQSAINSAAALGKELVSLRADWAHRQAESEKATAGRVEEHLLSGFDQLVRWLTAIQRWSDELGLDLTYHVGKASAPPPPLEGITLIPIELKVQPQNHQQAYRHFLKLVRNLSEATIRADLEHVSLSGKGGGVKSMSLRLKLWMKAKA